VARRETEARRHTGPADACGLPAGAVLVPATNSSGGAAACTAVSTACAGSARDAGQPNERAARHRAGSAAAADSIGTAASSAGQRLIRYFADEISITIRGQP